VDPLSELAQRIAACERCQRLVAWRAATARPGWWARPVPGFGDPEARLVVVGLAPSRAGANAHGRMFTGDRSADLLVRTLFDLGLASQPCSRDLGDGLVLEGVWLTAAARCAPPGNRPLASELGACRDYLAEELALLPWRSLVALGRIAWDAAQRAVALHPVAFAHGTTRRVGDKLLLASYHPSPQNTNTGRLSPTMLRAVLGEGAAYAGVATT